jgi:sec-independent protein translocase protein TatA
LEAIMLGELFQPMHLLLILVIALLLFGPGKLPQIAANMGKSIREFKSALSAPDEIKVPAQQAEAQPAQPVQQAQVAQPAQPAPQPAAQAEAPKQEQKGA